MDWKNEGHQFVCPTHSRGRIDSGCTRKAKTNQRSPSTSPSGKYVLTVPIERDPTVGNLRYWRVTISDTTGKQLHKDNSKFIGALNVYWCWDSADRVWLYNSDDG
jgi:hypothetical protein